MAEALTAGELLAEMKERAASALEVGNYSVLMLIEQDPLLKRLIAVWPNVMVGRRDAKPEEKVPADLPERARLDWLWARLEPDPIPDWLRLAGLPDASHTRRAIRLAIDNRMVLPDGGLANPVRTYVGRAAVRAIGPEAGAPRPPRRREEPPPPVVDDE